jgi:hypothetical protein
MGDITTEGKTPAMSAIDKISTALQGKIDVFFGKIAHEIEKSTASPYRIDTKGFSKEIITECLRQLQTKNPRWRGEFKYWSRDGDDGPPPEEGMDLVLTLIPA